MSENEAAESSAALLSITICAGQRTSSDRKAFDEREHVLNGDEFNHLFLDEEPVAYEPLRLRQVTVIGRLRQCDDESDACADVMDEGALIVSRGYPRGANGPAPYFEIEWQEIVARGYPNVIRLSGPR